MYTPISDPAYLERRHREFIECMRPFSKMLEHVHLCSTPKIVYHFDTSEMETILDEKSQRAIDHIINERNKYVKECFPEFYNPE